MTDTKVVLRLFFAIILLIFIFSFDLLFSQQKVNGRIIKEGVWKDKQINYVDGQIAVMLKPGVRLQDISSMLATYHAIVIEDFNKLRWGMIELPENTDIFSFISFLKANPLIQEAEPNGLLSSSFNPNDIYFVNGYQWYLNNVGQSPPGGTANADIHITQAWDITRGNSNVIIAVLDSGIPMMNDTLSHPDLKNSNRIILGIDCVPDGEGLRDNCGHGSHVAGIVGAETNNDTGIAGVASGCKIMIIKCVNDEGKGGALWFQNGVIYAVDHGAKIINYSSGGQVPFAALEQGVQHADSNNCLIVAASGNGDNNGNPLPVDFPAAFSGSYPNVIAVGSTDCNDIHVPYTNYGPQLSVVAPGGFGTATDGHRIYSTTPNYPFYLEGKVGVSELYGYLEGTSMATPQVAGIAGLLLSIKSTQTPNQIRNIIQNTADDKGATGRDDYYGYGRVNANRAVLYAKYNIVNILVDASISGSISQNTLVRGNINVTDNLTVNAGVNFIIEDGSTVKIAANKSITVNGTIVAKNDTFQKVTGSSNWSGIIVTGTGSDSYLKNCTITDATVGVTIGGSKYINIYHDKICGSTAAILIQENGNPDIWDCYLKGTGTADIYSTGNANGKVYNCSLCGTAAAGHKSVGSASTIFSYYNNARNIINGRTAPTSIYVLGGYPAFANGSNIIERSYGGSFDNESGHSLNAYNNYWQGGMTIIGPVVYNPVLTNPPNPVGPDWILSKSSRDLLAEAWKAYAIGEYSNAEELAKEAFNDDKSSEQSSEALFLQMKSAFQLGNLPDKENDLLAVRNDKEVHSTAKSEAVRWQVKLELNKKNIDNATSLALSIPDTSRMSLEILLDLAIGLIENLKEFENAEKILSLYESRFPGEQSKELKNEILSMYKRLYAGESSLPKDSTELNASIVPEKNKLLSNYPNPFNPTTNISYQLSAVSHVSLKVFDMLGREVATLVDGIKDAGYYTATFDGTRFSSGIYFVRITVMPQDGFVPFTKTMKMLMVK